MQSPPLVSQQKGKEKDLLCQKKGGNRKKKKGKPGIVLIYGICFVGVCIEMFVCVHAHVCVAHSLLSLLQQGGGMRLGFDLWAHGSLRFRVPSPTAPHHFSGRWTEALL